MSDPFETVMGPLGVLRERIAAVFAECGLEVLHVGIVPGSSVDGPHEVQMLAMLGGEPPAGEDEEFQQVIAQARDAELDQRSSAVRDELQDRLRGGKGFLGDSAGDE